jgi:hypothetical protein
VAEDRHTDAQQLPVVYPDRDVATVQRDLSAVRPLLDEIPDSPALEAARHRVDVALQPDGESVVTVRRTWAPAHESVPEVPSRA